MTRDATIGRELEDWLSEGPTEAPGTVLSAVLVAVPRTARRGGLVHRLRMGGVRSTRGISIGLVAALIILTIGLMSLAAAGSLATKQSSVLGPTDAPRVSTTGWVPFTSVRFGYSISHPDGWVVTPATAPWSSGSTPSSYDGSRDEFNSNGTDGFWFAVASQPVLGMTETAWLRDHERRSGLLEACYPPPERMGVTTVAGRPAYVQGEGAPCRSLEAIVFVDGRVYSLRGSGFADPNQGPPFDRATFDAFLSTVQFLPASAHDAP